MVGGMDYVMVGVGFGLLAGTDLSISPTTRAASEELPAWGNVDVK